MEPEEAKTPPDDAGLRDIASYSVTARSDINIESFQMESSWSKNANTCDAEERICLLAAAQSQIVKDLKRILDPMPAKLRREGKAFFLDNAHDARDFIE